MRIDVELQSLFAVAITDSGKPSAVLRPTGWAPPLVICRPRIGTECCCGVSGKRVRLLGEADRSLQEGLVVKQWRAGSWRGPLLLPGTVGQLVINSAPNGGSQFLTAGGLVG